MKRKPLLVTSLVAALAAGGLVPLALRAEPSAQGSSPDPKTAAVVSAERLIAGRVAELHPSKGDNYVRTQVVGTPWRLNYVAYERTYRGLPVVGGDFVVATDDQGHVRNLNVAQKQPVNIGVQPKIGKEAAAKTSRAALSKPDKTTDQKLVVHALQKPRLAWETTVTGRDDGHPSLKKVYVDALTGKRFDEQEQVVAGTGTGIWEGSNLTIGTTQSGGQYTMQDPERPGLSCADYSGSRIFSGPDDVWGSTSKTSREAGCVDVMYAGAGQWDLLKSFGRTGLNGGRWAPAYVGLNEVNAYWQSGRATFGHNQQNQWITSTDVVAHEFGHGLDSYTPGGISGGNTQEFVGDVWGAAVEHFLNNPTDRPDYTVGEEVNLVGRGPIRNMYNPSQVNSDPNCYSSSVPSMEVHKAAGPGNHWFYLLAEGNNPGGGKPTSPICSGGPSSVTGIGIMNAAKIFYNAMMLKTSGTNYARYRVLTLQAAKNLDPTCNWYSKVKDAWDAVTMPKQTGEPTCTPTGNDFSMSVSPSSGTVKAGASVQATVSTTVSGGSSEPVDLSASVSPAGSGVTASFSPARVPSGNTSTLTITADDTARTGPVTVTVTGKGATATRTATYALNVQGGDGPGPNNPPNVNVENVKAHLQQFQTIAQQNGGTRYAAGGGYTASVAYVEQKLKAAGFTVTRQACTSGCTAGAGPNLIADWPGGNANNVYMFGAHLDGVRGGPGINDNGTGSAALLETALTLAQSKPTMLNQVRFAWWTDEEQGLNGSEFYVGRLSATERSKIKGYFNFDMVGSTNAGYFIDNLNSQLSSNLKGYFDSIGVVPDEMGECCSDDGPFRNAGIATSFLSTGASATKSSAQAQKWGGTAGRAFDPCYHQSCDSYPSNVNTTALDRNADAIAWALWKTSVNQSAPADDFSMTADPTNASVKPGEAATSTITTAVTEGAAQAIDLTATVTPGGPKVTFSPASIQAGGRSTMTVATTADTQPGDYTVKVTGTGKSATHTANFTLRVQGDGTNDFSVSVDPSNGTVEAGKSTTATVRTALTAGTAQQVALSATVSPNGPTVTVNPGEVKAGATATLNVSTTDGTPEGDYTVTVTGKGSVTRTATYTLTVTKKQGGRTATSETDYPIRDYTWTVSPLRVDIEGPAATEVSLSIDARHTCAEDVAVWLASPNGQTYVVKRQGTGQYQCTPWNGPMTFEVPGVSSPASGTWQLYMYDYGPGDTGTLNGWSISL
ncbi:Zn-dependent metalloprotease [Actinomadura pelletieri DSM 43383]|uniref:Zn-dependent metalloprotease n=1 Tax=Actinomadura pelletieri DSM 43383 TaxID=1120940 RepID=A0A495QXR0_9ACTN|nr:Zn-dependent metalloprotease [Actinomadura pelletieri DSM 43383]